jgi:hypothetical protein
MGALGNLDIEFVEPREAAWKESMTLKPCRSLDLEVARLALG